MPEESIPQSMRDALAYLNSILALDPKAVSAVFDFKIRCKEALADHPACIVWTHPPPVEEFWLSAMGVIAGLINVEDYRLTAICADDGVAIESFSVTKAIP